MITNSGLVLFDQLTDRASIEHPRQAGLPPQWYRPFGLERPDPLTPAPVATTGNALAMASSMVLEMPSASGGRANACRPRPGGRLGGTAKEAVKTTTASFEAVDLTA